MVVPQTLLDRMIDGDMSLGRTIGKGRLDGPNGGRGWLADGGYKELLRMWDGWDVTGR